MRRIVVAIAASALALGAVGAVAVQAAVGPKIKELSFAQVDDGSPRHYLLDAYVKDADEVEFTAGFGGKSATGGSRLKSNISGKPWRLEGGNGVVPLIRDSLDATGAAKVKVTAASDDGDAKASFKIELAACSMDPPLYPLSCDVKN